VDELDSSLGIVALSLLGLQLVLPARLPLVSGGLGADLAVRLHRRLADVTFAVIAAHVAVVVLAEPARAAFLAFVGTPWPVQAAVVSTAALGALASSSTWRGRLRLPYSTWRALHLGLAAGALVFATAHTIGVDRYLTRGIAAVWLALLVLGSLAALVELRVLRPRRLARDAYVVQEVVPEPGGATTIKLLAKGHDGKPFRPGQFAWLRLADDSTRLAEHPFSYASSALTPARPVFTIKAYDGFSRKIAQLPPGADIVLDGPHGSYRPAHDATGFVLIAGGIGITPSLSLLRTAADLTDPRPYLLLYASRSEEEIVLADELEGLTARLDLTVVHVPVQPVPRVERGARPDQPRALRPPPAGRSTRLRVLRLRVAAGRRCHARSPRRRRRGARARPHGELRACLSCRRCGRRAPSTASRDRRSPRGWSCGYRPARRPRSCAGSPSSRRWATARPGTERKLKPTRHPPMTRRS